MRVIITDDEPPARYLIRRLLQSEKDIDIVGEAEDAAQSIDLIRSANADLLFLDIQLPGDGAFTIIDCVGAKKMPHVIFVTAHREHAVKAFDLPAVDYLLKPVDPERFRDAVARARESISRSKGIDLESVAAKLQSKLQKRNVRRLKVYDGGKWILVQAHEIMWVKAERNHTRAYLHDSNFKMRGTISALETELPDGFVRIHRSIIVNINCMREVIRLPHGEYRLILQNGTKLHLSRKYRNRILDA